MEEDYRANDFIDYQNPFMFLEFPWKLIRENNEHKALYPSLEELNEGVLHKIQANKNLKNLRFKIWAKEMNEKLKDKITNEEE